MWEMFTRHGMSLAMPPDSFVFWATLEEHSMVSNTSRTSVLWCMSDENMCFGSTLLDAELWFGSHGSTVSGQWRVVDGRLTLLKPCDVSLFPTSCTVPLWLSKRLENK